MPNLAIHCSNSRRSILAFLTLLCAVLLSPLARAQSWTLVWSDEFNQPAGTYPDPAKWTYELGDSGFGNPELEDYCAPGSSLAPCVATQPNAFQDGDGHLVIQARRDSNGKWTSARLRTKGLYQFQYGRVEARLKLPIGHGFWPAFWLLGSDIDSSGWPRCGELDIMEWVQSYGPNTTSSTVHGPGYSGAHGIGAHDTFPASGRIDEYHIYGLLWSPNLLQFYRDTPDNIFLTLTPTSLPPNTRWVFDHPFFPILNLAIGRGGFPGSTDDTTPSVATMLVDYVRVYKRDGPEPTASPTTPARSAATTPLR